MIVEGRGVRHVERYIYIGMYNIGSFKRAFQPQRPR